MDLIFSTKYQRKTNKQHPTATIPSKQLTSPHPNLPKPDPTQNSSSQNKNIRPRSTNFWKRSSEQNASNPHSPPPVRIINDQTTLKPPSPRIE